MTDRFPETLARLTAEVDDGQFTRGAQVTVEQAGEVVLDVALGEDGLGRPLTRHHLLRVYCTIKPVTTLAVAALVDTGALDLDEPLGPLLPDVRGLDDGVTLRHVLTHTAGLHRPMGIEMEIVRPEARRERVAATARPAGWRLGVDAAYSEYAGWHVLGWILEARTGRPLRDHLRERILDPLGLRDTWVGMPAERYRQVRDRIGVNTDFREHQPFPMLFERTERICRETNPAHGGYTTSSDLVRLYRAVLDGRAGIDGPLGISAATLAEFCRDARPVVHDEVLDRECPYGLGFMTTLGHHAFGTAPSPSAFGHSGNVGTSFAFADPEHDLAVAAVFNGLVGHDSSFLRRRVLVGAVYDDLLAHGGAAVPGGAAASGEAPAAGTEAGRRGRRRLFTRRSRPGPGADPPGGPP